jgi:hypothetical protein
MRFIVFIFLGLFPFSSIGLTVYTFEQIEENFLQNLKLLESYITKGVCEHFYVDMGTNIGIQLRKLYEPQYYPGAEVIPYFDSFYGKGVDSFNRTRTNVCSIGFEPNHLHIDRLMMLQSKYRQAGYPMVVFIGVAIFTENKRLTFYQKPDWKQFNEWGSSLLKWSKANDMIEQPVLGIDAAAFYSHIFGLWRQQWTQPTANTVPIGPGTPSSCFQHNAIRYGNCSALHTLQEDTNGESKKHKVLGKLDIEGAEYQVLPHLIMNGNCALCLFDELMIEFHDARLVSQETIDRSRHFFDFWYKDLKTCDFKMIDLDDEAYGYGEDTHPMPQPPNHFNTSKFHLRGNE